MAHSPIMSPRSTPKIKTAAERQMAINNSHAEGSTPSRPNGDGDLVNEVIADLALDCDNAFTGPRYRPRGAGTTHFRNQPQQKSTYQVEQAMGNSENNNSGTMPEIKDEKNSGRESVGSAHLRNFSRDVGRHYKSPRGSDLSSEHHNDMADSAVSLQVLPSSKRTSGRSQLRETHTVDDDEPGNQHPGTTNGEAEATLPTTPTYPSTAKTALIMVSLYISIFLVALDRTIMGPAIPAITNQFNSISDIGWYGSAYMLTSAGFILLYGRIYTFFSTKKVFLSGIFLFEIGSAICGAAQTSIMLIVGRAIAGLGSSGIFTGAILILLNTVPLHRRPLLQGLFGACFGVASVAGPLLGGAFTGSKLTWRWCFYINLPLGGITILVVMFLLKLDEQKPKLGNWKETIRNLDPLGTMLFLPSIICLLLALEWGAAEYAWNSPRLIALLAVFAALFTGFGIWQYLTRNTTATLPARVLMQRSVVLGGASQFCVGSTMLTFSLYLPLWFQAIKGTSAMQSGINTIPLVLSVVVGSILSGGLVQRIGYYTPFMIMGSILMAVGAGLATTWNTSTRNAMWIGNQAILGFGVGCTMQQPNLAIQVVLPREDVPTGTALLSLCQTLGGAVFAAVGQNLYIDKFSASLQRIQGLDSGGILHSGATDLTNTVPSALRQQVLEAYNKALTKGTFFAALIVACLAVPAALGMEWRSVKEKQQQPTTSATHDEEKVEPMPKHSPDDTAPPSAIGQSSSGQSSEASLLTPPVATWKKMYRSSGQFTEWMTAKVNPDLRDSGLIGGR